MLQSTVYKASQWIWSQRIYTGVKGGKRQQEGGHSLENGIIIGLVQFFQVLPLHQGRGWEGIQMFLHGSQVHLYLDAIFCRVYDDTQGC